MDVTINNIAKIRSAKLVCQGLTAIIGDNDKGKSTVGKVLYSIFHTFANLKEGFFDARAGYVKSHPSAFSGRLVFLGRTNCGRGFRAKVAISS